MSRRRDWELIAGPPTSESGFRERRRFVRQAGLAGLGLIAGGCATVERDDEGRPAAGPPRGVAGDAAIAEALHVHGERYPAPRNDAFMLDRPLTDRAVAAAYVNFYEFRNDKDRVAEEAAKLTLRPWTVSVSGLVEEPFVIDVDELQRRLPVEERLYRHRCVEAWAMAVPWTGMPLRAFVEMCRPLSAARYVRFVSFMRPAEAIGQRLDTHYAWPYYEALRLDEATHELALLATGIYGAPLPPQHGAPVRIVVPWKYGYKSAKSIARVEFVGDRPGTFWNDLEPAEYDFLSNVDPTVPHPRWSQATERMLGTDERRPTLPYNGYAEWVASLYS